MGSLGRFIKKCEHEESECQGKGIIPVISLASHISIKVPLP